MTAVIKLFWNICLFRGGPERAPRHPLAIAILLALDFALAGWLFDEFTEETAWDGISSIIVSLCVSAVIIFAALSQRGNQSRFLPTFSANVGCDLLIGSLMAVALLITSGNLTTSYPFNIWGVGVSGFILHRALEIPLPAGILLAIGILFAGFVVSIFLLGPPAGATG